MVTLSLSVSSSVWHVPVNRWFILLNSQKSHVTTHLQNNCYFFLIYKEEKKRKLASFTILNSPKSNYLIAYGSDWGFICKLTKVLSLLLPHCQSVVFGSTVCCSCFTYWSLACPVVWGEQWGSKVFCRNQYICSWTRPLALLFQVYSWVKSLHSSGNDCEYVSNHRNGLRSHSHSPLQTNSSLSLNSPLVVQETLPFCASVALISSKHLCLVYWRTCERSQNILHFIYNSKSNRVWLMYWNLWHHWPI